MGNKYKQLTLTERYKIEAYDEMDFSARYIAKILGRSNKSVSQELKRCPKGQYCAEAAHKLGSHNRRNAKKFNKQTTRAKIVVDALLEFDLSPEQIAGRMKLEEYTYALGINAIYRMITNNGWRSRLPRKGKKYRKRSGSEAGVHLIPNRVDIDDRPDIVNENTELGHWEGDTVHGQNGYFVTLAERVSKTFLFMRVKRKDKGSVARAVKKLLKPFKKMCKTITFDNGGEFAGHGKIAKALGCSIFFAKPYHSWQRGLNENSNGLLRRYFPKGMEINGISTNRLKYVQFLINSRPRKALDYLSPLEFLTGERVSFMKKI